MSGAKLRNCDVINMYNDLGSEGLTGLEIISIYRSNCNPESLRLKVRHVVQLLKKKKKNKSTDIDTFLDQDFTLPVDRTDFEFPNISLKEKEKN